MRTNDLKQSWKPTPRRKLMAMVHIAAQQLNIEHGSVEYRTWLQNLTGKPSCKDLTDEQLRELIATLRQQGCLERKATGSARLPEAHRTGLREFNGARWRYLPGGWVLVMP